MVDEDADARPRLELDHGVFGPDGEAAADVVHGDGPAEEEQGIYGHLSTSSWKA